MTSSFRASAIFLSLVLVLILAHCHGANNTLTPGQSLQDGQTIFSPSETFALGFFSPNTNSGNRYLGIWYNKIPVRTIAWVANRENPVLDSSGVLTFRSDGNLVVLDGNGRSLWSTNASVLANNATASLLDSGNLCFSADQVCDAQTALWHSFEDPTDTYLPGMRVFLKPRSPKDLLTSWRSESDPARGNFSVGINPTGLLELVEWKGEEKHWRSGLWNGQIFIGVLGMVGNYLYGSRVTDLGGKTFFSYVARNSSDIFRFRIRWDGLFQQLSWNEGKKEWTSYWAEPDGICEVYNKCGTYGSCSESSSPICSCLPGFLPKSRTEWDSGNWSSGCVRRTELLCDRNITSAMEQEQDQFLELDKVKLPDFYVSLPSLNKTQCADVCLKNCSCMAYAYVDGIQCLTWAQGFADIQIFPVGGQKLFIRLAASEIAAGKRRNKPMLVIAITVTVGVIFLCASAYMWRRCLAKSGNFSSKGKKETVLVDVGPEGSGSELTVHSIQDILTATNNFSNSNTLGEGGFGPVYKGKLPGGLDVAVKRLSRMSSQGLQEFKNEIILIAKLQHRNLVRLIGYCVEEEEKILVYEYLPNKSLDVFIFGKSEKKLDAVQRCSIIEGIARGLLYLHRDSRLRIIHRDLKASNILLDEELNPKISDFGMAKIFGEQHQENTNRVVGTYGYMSPEYAMQGIFSVKSDVYGFGVLLLEIVSGKRNQYTHPEYSVDLIGYAWKLWSEDRAMEFIDPLIRDSCPTQSCALRCINIGLLCVQDSPMDRPIMSTVVQMLESDTAILPIPRQPTFTVVRHTRGKEMSRDSSLDQSRNIMTSTLIIGR